MKYYYKDSKGESKGPLTLGEIRALAGKDEVGVNPEVLPSGGDKWVEMSTLAALPDVDEGEDMLTKDPLAGAKVANDRLFGWVGMGVEAAGKVVTVTRVNAVLKQALFVGRMGVLAAIVLTVVYSLVAAVRHDSFMMFLTGLGLTLGLIVLQYAAVRFMKSAEGLIGRMPCRVSSMAFLECVWILMLLAAICSALGGVILGVNTGSLGTGVLGIAGAILMLAVGALALHPEMVGIEVGEGTAGEEAVGLMAFFLKMSLKLAPLCFGVLSIAGVLVILIGFFYRNESELALMLAQALPGFVGVKGMTGVLVVLYACMVPVLVYLNFLIGSLVLELIGAVLRAGKSGK